MPAIPPISNRRTSKSKTIPIMGRSIRIEYPDDDLQVRVVRFLGSKHFPAFMDLEIQVLHGQVTLSGEVNSYYEKQIAMTSTQHVAGVLALVDHIRVRKPK